MHICMYVLVCACVCNVCLCMHVYVGVYSLVHMLRTEANGGSFSLSGFHFVTFFMEPESCHFSLTHWLMWLYDIHVCRPLALTLQIYATAPWFCLDAEDLNLGLHVYTAIILSTVLSPQPLNIFFSLVLILFCYFIFIFQPQFSSSLSSKPPPISSPWCRGDKTEAETWVKGKQDSSVPAWGPEFNPHITQWKGNNLVNGYKKCSILFGSYI